MKSFNFVIIRCSYVNLEVAVKVKLLNIRVNIRAHYYLLLSLRKYIYALCTHWATQAILQNLKYMKNTKEIMKKEQVSC